MTEIGASPITATLKALETWPSGFATVTGTELLTVAVVPAALSCVEETYVVASDTPPNFTTAPLRKAEPVTVKLNAPVFTGFGATDEMTGAGYRIVTAALPLLAGTATLVARTVTVAGFGTAEGAEYIPKVSMYPTVELPPSAPLTDQVTDWSATFCTVAVNCWLAWVTTVADDGVTETDTPGCFAWPESGSIISEDTSTASKAEPKTFRRVLRLVLFQRGSGSPEMNHAEPLSLSIIPYFFSARRITCTSAGKPEMSKFAFKRNRCPMGG